MCQISLLVFFNPAQCCLKRKDFERCFKKVERESSPILLTSTMTSTGGNMHGNRTIAALLTCSNRSTGTSAPLVKDKAGKTNDPKSGESVQLVLSFQTRECDHMKGVAEHRQWIMTCKKMASTGKIHLRQPGRKSSTAVRMRFLSSGYRPSIWF